jgi:hypothetical protein
MFQNKLQWIKLAAAVLTATATFVEQVDKAVKKHGKS